MRTSVARRNRSDSRAHRIAAGMKAEVIYPPRRPGSVSKMLTRGAIVGQYEIPSTADGIPNQTLTAAATILFGKSVSGASVKRAPAQPWQSESWELRREIGEFRFAGDRTARALSLCNLWAAVKVPGQALPIPLDDTADPRVAEIVEPLFSSVAQLEQALKRVGQHLNFNGETLLLISQQEDGSLKFTAASPTEITGSGDTMKFSDGVETRTLSEDTDLVIRCHIPDPEQSGLADCAARAVLPPARELRGLTQHTSAQIDSRLAGAGLLIVPNDIEVLAGQGVEMEILRDEDGIPLPDQPEADAGEFHPFVEALVENMTVPISNRDSAAALVPLVVKCHPDAIDKIRHLKFESTLDPMAKDLREEAIRRIALGMDSPPEVLLGMGSANHWSAWQVSEEEITLVVAPLAATVCHALTIGFLHPALESLGIPDVSRYQIWFDTTRLQLRPDRSSDASALFDKGELSREALIRENGFDKDDQPTDEERQDRFLRQLILARPDLFESLAPMIGINLEGLAPAAEVEAPAGEEPEVQEVTPEIDQGETDERTPPERDTTPPEPEPAP